MRHTCALMSLRTVHFLAITLGTNVQLSDHPETI